MCNYRSPGKSGAHDETMHTHTHNHRPNISFPFRSLSFFLSSFLFHIIRSRKIPPCFLHMKIRKATAQKFFSRLFNLAFWCSIHCPLRFGGAAKIWIMSHQNDRLPTTTNVLQFFTISVITTHFVNSLFFCCAHLLKSVIKLLFACFACISQWIETGQCRCMHT